MVNDLPLQIDNLDVRMANYYIRFNEICNGEKIEHWIWDAKVEDWASNEHILDISEEVNEEVVKTFLEKVSVLLQNRSLRINVFKVAAYCMEAVPETTANRKVYVALKVLNSVLVSLNRSLWVKEFRLHCGGNVDDLLYILPCLKPKHLKKITLMNQFNDRTNWENIISLVQWKEAEHIYIHSAPNYLPIDAIQRFQKYETRILQ